MSESRQALASYREAVSELINAGEPFGDVEDAIDEVPELTIDQKAALWLFAFSLRDPAGKELDARTRGSAVLPARAADSPESP